MYTCRPALTEWLCFPISPQGGDTNIYESSHYGAGAGASAGAYGGPVQPSVAMTTGRAPAGAYHAGAGGDSGAGGAHTGAGGAGGRDNTNHHLFIVLTFIFATILLKFTHVTMFP